MCGNHLHGVHAIDMICPEDHDVVRILVVHEVEALKDRVGTARVPARAQSLLGRHWCHVVAEKGGHAPRRRDVPIQGVGLVLGQDADAAQAGVDEVGEDEVDEPIGAPERHCWLGSVSGQRHQSLALPAREDHRKDARIGSHRASPAPPDPWG